MSYYIGDLSRLTGESQKTLRYWTNQGLLQAERSPTNYRLYSHGAVESVAFIRTAQTAGFRLRDIKHLLELAKEPRPCREVKALAELRLAQIRQQLEHLKALEASLTSLVTTPETACPDTACHFLPEP